MPDTKCQYQEQLLTLQPKLGRVSGFILTVTGLGPQCHLRSCALALDMIFWLYLASVLVMILIHHCHSGRLYWFPVAAIKNTTNLVA